MPTTHSSVNEIKCHAVVYPIGPWNMDTSETITIANPITPADKLIDVRILAIRNDDDSLRFLPNKDTAGASPSVLVSDFSGTTITLFRFSGRHFDSTSFDNVAGDYNRGWIMCIYEAN